MIIGLEERLGPFFVTFFSSLASDNQPVIWKCSQSIFLWLDTRFSSYALAAAVDRCLTTSLPFAWSQSLHSPGGWVMFPQALLSIPMPLHKDKTQLDMFLRVDQPKRMCSQSSLKFPMRKARSIKYQAAASQTTGHSGDLAKLPLDNSLTISLIQLFLHLLPFITCTDKYKLCF